MSHKREHVLECGGVRVRFCWRDDRFAHEILLRDGDQWREALRSVEGTADDRWPASPPLQSLNVENRSAGSQIALLVGMAGRSHWSASIETDETASAVRFDIACRLAPGESGPLGSQYRAKRAPTIIDDRRAQFEGQPGADTILQLQPGTPELARLSFAGEVLRISPPAVSAASAARTIRWSYWLAAARA